MGRILRSTPGAAGLAAAALVLSGCSPYDKSDIKRLALPVPASDRTDPVWDLWLGAWIATLVVFVLVFGLMVYAMIRFRKRDENPPPQIRYHLPLEVLYTIAPCVIVAVFFFHTVVAQNAILKEVKNPDHEIVVVGSKWQWAFDYQDEKAAGGEDVFDVGTPADPANLYLPIDESVRFVLKAPDVIHSFWIPEFYFKMDVIPGRINQFDVTPTRMGTFTGRCAELCGLYHSRMIFKVHVVSRAEYDKHMAELKAIGQVGELAGAKQADKIAGLENGDEH
ncbi:MAG TPA: cytochrome c oxidase subunit II [Aeromicrobium sp.]|nr:cytochrome c oxidase subunit II [Aeromicrobium sp.]HKY57835.1 cytochrome c oxidase subunit II [Aeromicrobium sp.]